VPTVDLVVWACAEHGVIERHPDDGRDRRNARGERTERPIGRSCPACGRELRRTVERD
jgi:endogenous inhibitor of DNA gyrase (YacG/DUF329 family)